jgi:DNA repair protein RadA/Sms
MAIASAHRNLTLDPHTLWIGEVGLGGEIRAVGALPLRLAEAAQLGFKRAFVPKQSLRESTRELHAMKLEIHGISTLSDALAEQAPIPERQTSS